MTAERMSRVDTAWLRMDSDANRMVIVGVWLLAPRLSVDEVRKRAMERLLAYRRFRQKVVEDAVGAQWVDDRHFDIQHHVQREWLEPHAGEPPLDALKRRVADLATWPLDPSRPLWQWHVVEDLDGEHSALISRIHHCIGDGIALMSVMLSLADGGTPPPKHPAQQADDDAWLDDLSGVMQMLMHPVARATTQAGSLAAQSIRLGRHGIGKGLDVMAQSTTLGAPGLEAARLGMQVVNDAMSLLLMPDDSHTRLKGRATPGKRVAWGEPLPLDEVKAVSKALGVSINDVLLSCVAGAIGAYLRTQGDDPRGQELRAMVPVNLRPPEDAWKLGNRFGMVPLVLPIGLDNPAERLYTLHRRMAELKGSTQPLLAFGVLALSGLVIKPMQDAITGLFARKTTAVMTNVPGPAEPIRFCERTVKQVMFWVPQSGDIGVGVSILSYGGGVQFGLITDAQMCPEPQNIVTGFEPEFDKLMWLALMSPWPAV
jgi:diacylglycerol O-acyltransferase / wax synthase